MEPVQRDDRGLRCEEREAESGGDLSVDVE
jgi:hypothetical protein